jgi:hypothetical protein
MTREELYGAVWREMARREGHKPLHLIVSAAERQADSGSKQAPRGYTAERVREAQARGMSLRQAAEALGIAEVTAHKHAQRLGIKFADGRAA